MGNNSHKATKFQLNNSELVSQPEAELEKTPITVCQYQWDLVGIRNKTVTILSKMIKFQGVKSFRVGLKKQATSYTLLLITTNLNKLGLKAVAVTYSSPNGSNETMTLKTTINEDKKEIGCLQLFTAPLDTIGIGNRSFIFKIYLSGVVQDYRAEEVDLCLRNQLRSSFSNQAGTDFKIVVEGKKIPVHKFMLAARSPVFAAKFQEENYELEDKEKIRLVDTESVQQFIKFIYTGELEGPVKNDHLMQLAVTYKIKTLEDLCQAASADTDRNEMASLGMIMKPAEAEEFIMEIQPDNESEIKLSTSLIFKCTWTPKLPRNEIIEGTSCVEVTTAFEYQQEKLFQAQIRRKVVLVPNPAYNNWNHHHRNLGPFLMNGSKTKLVFLSYHHEKMGYKVDEVTYSTGTGGDPWTHRLKMREKLTSDHKKLQVFAVELISTPSSVTFHVKVAYTVPNFGLTFADSTWTQQLWAAAVEKVLTDVEFLIAEESILAHRSLLSARSPVFAAMFSAGMEEARTGQVRIEDVDPDSFRHFLQFLYTGNLVATADKAKIFTVADKYQVETLMGLCRPSTQPVDIEEITEAFLSC